jgi:hypothetical protein
MANSTLSMTLRQAPGQMSLKTGELDLLMTPGLLKPGFRIPFVADTLTFHVGGALNNPRIDHRPLKGTSDGIRRIFRGGR